MKIYTLWGKRPDDTTELMVAWDEYCVDGNPEGFEEALAEARKSWGSDLVDDRPLAIEIPDEAVERLFEHKVVKAKMVSNDEPEAKRWTDSICSVCGAQQYVVSSGITCTNGHGGAPPKEI